MFKARNIYNVKTQMRRKTLESLTFVQTLIRELDQDDWVYQFQKNMNNQIIHLFFIRDTSQIMLKTNFEVFIINCIYKINRYKMLLLIISDQTTLHINYYVDFCFMTKETSVDYYWILQQLKNVYTQLQFSNSTVIITDMKKN
jgi:hypothetical protein